MSPSVATTVNNVTATFPVIVNILTTFHTYNFKDCPKARFKMSAPVHWGFRSVL